MRGEEGKRTQQFIIISSQFIIIISLTASLSIFEMKRLSIGMGQSNRMMSHNQRQRERESVSIMLGKDQRSDRRAKRYSDREHRHIYVYMNYLS